jgi:hypothetical protein
MGKGIEWLSGLDRIIVIKMTRKHPESTGLCSANYVARASGRGLKCGAWPRVNKKTLAKPAFG